DEAAVGAMRVLAGVGSSAEPLIFPSAALPAPEKASAPPPAPDRAPAPPPAADRAPAAVPAPDRAPPPPPPSSEGPFTQPLRSLAARGPATPFEAPAELGSEPSDAGPHTVPLARPEHAAAAVRGAALPFGAA